MEKKMDQSAAFMHVSSKVASSLRDEDLLHMTAPQVCSEDAANRIKSINDACLVLLTAIRDFCPTCADSQSALRCAREARMWASSAISLEKTK